MRHDGGACLSRPLFGRIKLSHKLQYAFALAKIVIGVHDRMPV